MKVTWLRIGLAACLLSSACAASAQEADESALDALDANAPKQPVVKQEPPGAAELRDAILRIARRPTDHLALTDAGYAAVKLGDHDAAFNFFTKANAIQPFDARIKAGLGIAQVRRENPFEALSLFDEAVRLGASERSFALDRGLAFDLLGNFERADRDYALSASLGDNEELTLRRAISFSLAGKNDEADRMLIPMLQRENPEAWRVRALMLAARGDHREASKIAAGFLPPSEARRMDGYFRNMTRLTSAQQAAAMHFGHFPLGSNIGQDSENVRVAAAATGAKPSPPGGNARLIPTGEPLGTKTATGKPAKPQKQPSKGKNAPRPDSGLTTANAQRAVDAASRSKATPVASAQLPPPEAARPPVRIALPAFQPPKAREQELPPTGPAVIAANTPPPVVPAPTLPTPTESGRDISIAQVEPKPLANQGPPPPVQVTTTPAPVPAAAAPVETGAVPQATPDLPPAQLVTIRIPGGTSAVENSPPADIPARPIQGPLIDQPSATVKETTVADAVKVDTGPIGPGFESVGENKVATDLSKAGPVAGADTQPQGAPAAEASTPAPVTIEKGFDLGALVASIEVPEGEKKPSVAPVDLNKIKSAPAKSEPAVAKGDPAAKAEKSPAAGPRYFVQIATGADTNGLAYDYRRIAKKHAGLFTDQNGWLSPWGKSQRLLVGPFADMKAAKKWEADFRKAGGDGFVWQSDKNAEVTKLKIK